VQGTVEGAEAVLRVRDTGVGIAPEALDRVFDLFTQGGRSEGGLGVGLTLARMLVELHGGTLTGASEGAERGSEFTVRLPLGAPALGEPGPSRATGQRVTPRRVLVIEDDEDTRDVLRLLLELDGHRVETAADGAHGVALATRSAPDVVLIDIGLPGSDGYTVARQIRSVLGPGVLLVAVTGYGREDDRRRAAAAGFDMHLVKPIDYEGVMRLLAGHDRRPDPAGEPTAF
jgi:CheY-like chemotaxis protein